MARIRQFLTRPSFNGIGTAVAIVYGLAYVVLWMSGASNELYVFANLVAGYFLTWGLVAILSKIPQYEIQKRFLLVTASLFGCLALIEAPGVSHFVDYREIFSNPGYPNWWNHPAFVMDDELVSRHKPHYRAKGKYTRGNIGEALCILPTEMKTYDLRYDLNGFRNATDLTSADIAVIGDSNVEAPMTSTKALMTTILGELQKSAVANLGLSGYGPIQELIVLKRYALPLHPKTIIWVFYEGNDLNDVDLYQRNLYKLKSTSPNPGPLASLWYRSFVRNLLSAVIRVRNGCHPDPALAEHFLDISAHDQTRVYLYDDMFRRSAPNESEALAITRSSLQLAYQLTREQGIRFVVVFAPTQFQVYSGLPTVARVSDKVRKWSVSDVSARLRSLVTDISPQIDYLDLTPIFSAETRDGNRMFLSDDTHWADEGHRAAAQALHKLLANNRQTIIAQNEREDELKNEVIYRVTKHAVMIRDADGIIRYWSKGAQDLYGWTPQEALGQSSHRLLNTAFPKPLPNIEAEIQEKKYWQGKLTHRRRDGSLIIVKSRWSLQENPRDRAATVVEINNVPNS